MCRSSASWIAPPRAGAERRAILAAAAALTLALAPASASARSFVVPADSLTAPGARTYLVALLPLRLAYRLPDAFLAEDGDSAWIAGRPLTRDTEYALDRARGEIRVLASYTPGETLRVRYRTLPVRLPMSVGLRPTWEAPDTTVAASGSAATAATAPNSPYAPRPFAAADTAGRDAAAQIRFSGNKSVSVAFGTRRDAALRQALDLTTTGRLGNGTEFTALLSDQNATVTQSGGTLDLSDLDKALVEVRAPHGAATLGDFTLAHRGGSFAQLTRELSGARAEARAGGLTAQSTVALEKGRFRTLEFRGEESRQGPYLLPDDQGAVNRPVVPGSERVWLDGERLARGEAADYAVDYDRGRLTFTSRRPITSASRIAVDYEIAGAPYRRMATALSADMTRGAWRLFGHAFREADDPGRPLTGFLSESDRQVLAAAGDDPERAISGGATAGGGDYDEVTSSGGSAYFAFAGHAAGLYQVEFTERGAGQGAYVESTLVDGAPVYRYVGTGAGTHVPGRRLALPGENRIVGGGAAFRPVPWVSLEGEVAGSRADLNRLSTLDDGADRGTAGRADLRLAPTLRWGGAERGTIEGGVRWSRRDASFLAPARQDSAFFQEDWGTDERDPLTGREERAASLGYRWRAFSVGGERARLDADEGFGADRWRGTLAWAGPLTQRLRLDRVDSESPGTDSLGYADRGHRDKLTYETAWTRTTWLRPSFTIDQEERVIPGRPDSAALRYRSWGAGLSGTRAALSWSGGFGFRRDFSLDGASWAALRTARDARLSVTAAPGASLTGSLGGSRRWTESSVGGRGRVDNGYARLRQQGVSGRLSHEAAAEWTSEIAFRRTRTIAFVGSGAGAYDSLGNFVGQGDYTIVDQEDPRAVEPLARAGLSYRADARPWASPAGGAGSAWSSLRVSGLVQSSAGRRGRLRASDFLALPHRAAQDTSFANASWLGRVEAEKPQGAVVLFVRGERSGSTDRSLAGSQTLSSAWAGEGRVRWRLDPRWLLESTARGARRDGFQSAGSYASSRRIDESAITLEATRFLAETVRLGLLTSLERAQAPGETPYEAWRTGPHAFYAVGNRGRLEATARWGRVRGEVVPTLFPSGFATRPDRFDFRLDASYRVRERANVDLTWSGHAPVGERLIHSALAELRTYF